MGPEIGCKASLGYSDKAEHCLAPVVSMVGLAALLYWLNMKLVNSDRPWER